VTYLAKENQITMEYGHHKKGNASDVIEKTENYRKILLQHMQAYRMKTNMSNEALGWISFGANISWELEEKMENLTAPRRFKNMPLSLILHTSMLTAHSSIRHHVKAGYGFHQPTI
jgi:hypothetical protein